METILIDRVVLLVVFFLLSNCRISELAKEVLLEGIATFIDESQSSPSCTSTLRLDFIFRHVYTSGTSSKAATREHQPAATGCICLWTLQPWVLTRNETPERQHRNEVSVSQWIVSAHPHRGFMFSHCSTCLGFLEESPSCFTVTSPRRYVSWWKGNLVQGTLSCRDQCDNGLDHHHPSQVYLGSNGGANNGHDIFESLWHILYSRLRLPVHG